MIDILLIYMWRGVSQGCCLYFVKRFVSKDQILVIVIDIHYSENLGRGYFPTDLGFSMLNLFVFYLFACDL